MRPTTALRLAAVIPLFGLSAPLLAQSGGAPAIDWIALALGTVGGLALFLFGVDLLADALRAAGGDRVKHLLERAARNRFAGLGAGTAATVLLDSSSVVIILVITLVDSGLLAFALALPVILGANIGTTLSSQVFAWNVDEWSPLLLIAGVIARLLARNDGWKRGATVAIGLGLILFGLHLIGRAAEPLADHPTVIDWLKSLGERPLMGVAAGMLVTLAIQSSSAMMGIVVTLAGGGLIALPAGLAMMLGAEIGTCADTLVATAGRSRAAVKAGLFHLGFNIASVAIGLALLGPLQAFATWSAEDTGQRIANAHVLFNVAGAMIAVPFVRTFAAWLERLVPDRTSHERPTGVNAT